MPVLAFMFFFNSVNCITSHLYPHKLHYFILFHSTVLPDDVRDIGQYSNVRVSLGEQLDNGRSGIVYLKWK